MIEQAIAAGWNIEAQFVAPDGQAVPCEAPVYMLAPSVIERVASTESPQRVLAVVAVRPMALPASPSFVMAAHHVSDPGNAGTIIRSGEAAGADAVAFTPGSVDVFNPKVVRSSAGSLFRIPVVEATHADLTKSGLRVFATSSHQGQPYTSVDLTGPVAVVVGNEAHGVPDDAAIDGWITIPHSGAAESLNVAMAATVLAFEVARQRRETLR